MNTPNELLKRVNVIGTSGSGKSTLAKKIAENLGNPYVELDALFWEPNWTEANDETFFARLEAALDKPSWVLDGNYDRTLQIKWKNVTAVIWVDYSLSRTIFQAIKRALLRSLDGKELWPGTGNRESLRKSFLSKDSIIIWTLKTYRSNKGRYEARIANPDYKHIKFIRLRNPREVRNFLESL